MDETTYKISSDRLYEKLQMIDKYYSEYAKSRDITYATLTILGVIDENRKNCTQKLICEQTHYPKQTVNIAVKGFLDQGYIEMKEMPFDRRNKYIALTESGSEYAKSMLDPLIAADRKAVETLGMDQYEMLIRLVTQYEEALKENLKLG